MRFEVCRKVRCEMRGLWTRERAGVLRGEERERVGFLMIPSRLPGRFLCLAITTVELENIQCLFATEAKTEKTDIQQKASRPVLHGERKIKPLG